MGRSKMSSLKITILPLAICLLLSLNSQVSGKPSPKHFLINTKEKAKKSSDYIVTRIDRDPIHRVIDASTNFDYVNNVNNGGVVGSIIDHSFNDYVNNIKNHPIIKIKDNFKDYTENNNNIYNKYI